MQEMNSYEILMSTLKGKGVDRIPCVQFSSSVIIEVIKELDYFWPDIFKDPKKMAEVSIAITEKTGLDSVSPPAVATMLAEPFGIICDYREKPAKRGKFLWPGVKFPGKCYDGTTISTPDDVKARLEKMDLASVWSPTKKVLAIFKEKFYGKVPIIMQTTDPFTPYPGYLVDPITFFMNYQTNPQTVGEFADALKPFLVDLANMTLEAGADVINFHIGGVTCDVISPDTFKSLVKPRLIDMLQSTKGPKVLDACGSATPIIADLIECGADAIRLDEKTDILEAKKIADSVRQGYPLAGNISSKDELHKGPVEKIREKVKFLIKIAKIDIVSSGCDFWLETPLAHIKVMVDATKEFGKKL